MPKRSVQNRIISEGAVARRRLDWRRLSAQTLFNLAPCASVLFDAAFEVVDCNDAALRLFGAESRQDLIERGVSLLDLCVPNFGGDIRDRFVEAVERGSCDLEATILSSSGDATKCSLTISRIPSGDTHLLALYERERVQTAQRRSNDEVISALMRISTDLMRCSPAALDRVIERSLEDLCTASGSDRAIVWSCDADDHSLLSALYRWDGGVGTAAARDETVFVPEWIDRLAIGQPIYTSIETASENERRDMLARGLASVDAFPLIISSDLRGVLAFDSFGTASPTVNEREIMQSAAALIAAAIDRCEMTSALIAAKEEATRSSETKSRFLTNMSHEIRTPLNAITGMTAVARASTDDPRTLESLRKIETASQQLNALLRDIFEMSKFESKNFTLVDEPFSVRKLISEIVEINRARAREKDQAIESVMDECLSGAGLIGDAQRIAQVITALLSYACERSPIGGGIRLVSELIDDMDEMKTMRIAVEFSDDTITDGSREMIRRMLESSDPMDSIGLGPGFAIAIDLLRLMGSRLFYSGERDGGSSFIFTITLPCAEVSDVSLSDDNDSDNAFIEYDFSGSCFMVVDDVEINREIIEMLMDGTGAEIVHAENGQDALDRFITEPERYSMIFMDVNMPVMGGLEAARRIRASALPNARDVIIAAVTTNSYEEEIQACLDAGMNDHIPKPVVPEVLMQKTCRWIGGATRRITG